MFTVSIFSLRGAAVTLSVSFCWCRHITPTFPVLIALHYSSVCASISLLPPHMTSYSVPINLPGGAIQLLTLHGKHSAAELENNRLYSACSLQTFPALDPDEVVFEPRSSRLLVRGLGENDMDEDEEDCESSARLLGMSFMNRSSAHRSNSSPYTRQAPPR